MHYLYKTYTILVHYIVGADTRRGPDHDTFGGTDRHASLLVAALAAFTLPLRATPAAAQDRRVALEVRGGFNVPTFDIADIAKAGPSFGAGIAYRVTPRLWLMGDADFGTHDPKLGTGDIKVYHFIGKLGYDLTAGREGPWSILINAGAGAMTFDAGGQSFTYPAINVGAKIAYRVSPQLAVVLSPQGDIAFSKKDELTTTNAWVWPFAAGLRVTF